jgi:hypothetical protein
VERRQYLDPVPDESTPPLGTPHPILERSREQRRQDRRAVLRSLGIVAVLFAAYVVLPLRGDHYLVGVVLGVALLAAMVPLTVSRAYRVLSSDRPFIQAIQSLIELVAMLIIGFAAAFYAMNRNGTQFSGLDTKIDSVYFTVTTLGTVGYGDLTATSQVARVLVTVQILFDLAFLGIAVRLIGGAATRRHTGEVPRQGQAPS